MSYISSWVNFLQQPSVKTVESAMARKSERVAKDIAEAAGADLFEIVPTEVYTSDDLDWTNPDSRVTVSG